MRAERGRRIAVVGAVLLVAAIVIAVQFGRLARQPQPDVAGPDDPPAGTQLLYVVDPARPHWIVAYDWTGARRGSIEFPLWVDISHLRPAPDGSGFMLDQKSVGDYAAYFDRRGRVQLETNEQTVISQAWSSDSRHICVVFDSDNGPSIVTRLPGVSDRTALMGLPASLAAAQIVLGTCDLRSDTADLAVQAGDTGDWHALQIRLSNGTLIRDRDVGRAAAAVSRDGTYVAFDGAVFRTNDLTTPLARFDSAAVPLAFSGDDSLLLAANAEQSTVEAVDWKTGKVTWRHDTGGQYGPWLARPSSSEFAVAVDGGAGGTPTIVIAHRDGSTTTLGSRDPVAW